MLRWLLAICLLLVFCVPSRAASVKLAINSENVVIPADPFALDYNRLCGKYRVDGRRYPVTLQRVVDGDTQDVLVDLGFGILLKKRLRLIGVDTPEKFGKTRRLGMKATEFSANWLKQHLSNLYIVVVGEGKYGRPLVYLCATDTARCLNEELLRSGNAKKYCGGKKE